MVIGGVPKEQLSCRAGQEGTERLSKVKHHDYGGWVTESESESDSVGAGVFAPSMSEYLGLLATRTSWAITVSSEQSILSNEIKTKISCSGWSHGTDTECSVRKSLRAGEDIPVTALLVAHACPCLQ